MAFNYKNIIQEKDIGYEGFNTKYIEIKEYSKYKYMNYRRKKRTINMKECWDLARRVAVKETYVGSPDNKVCFKKGVERKLIVTNILFPDEEKFMDLLCNEYKISIESCIKLKEAINILDKEDGDFLNGTLEGIVRYYIPTFDAIAHSLKMNASNEFIIWKLMEILYLNKELVKKYEDKEKIKEKV